MLEFIIGAAVGLVIGALCPTILAKVKVWTSKEKVLVERVVVTTPAAANTK